MAVGRKKRSRSAAERAGEHAKVGFPQEKFKKPDGKAAGFASTPAPASGE